MQVVNKIEVWILSGLVSIFFAGALLAQSATPTISGVVTDPSGAVIPAATVTATGPGGATLVAQTNAQGRYVFRNLAPGTYKISVIAKGFAPFDKPDVSIAEGGKAQVVDAQLTVTLAKQQVTVESEAQRLSVAPENNASAMVIKGEELQALSDDPDELQQELQQLAGPAAGPNGGQIYIDGFSGGQLPPKEAILEIRVNQDPFSAQYDRLGYGRIDIITKPGYSKWHGGAFTFFNNKALNSRNPFVGTEPNYHSEMISANIGGPLGKKVSFSFFFFHRKAIDNAIISEATLLDPTTFQPYLFSEAVRSPNEFNNYSPRFDLQLTSKNVLSVRAEIQPRTSESRGGGFALPETGSNSSSHGDEIHINDTQIISDRTVTQILLGYEREHSSTDPLSTAPGLSVTGAFSSGGSSGGNSTSTTNHWEVRNITSTLRGKHSLTYGGEVRRQSDAVNQLGGFNGSFNFASIGAYQVVDQGLAQGLTLAQILAACEANGGTPGTCGPNQFRITVGNPVASASVTDLAFFGEDAWRVRPNVSVTAGLRFETQNAISDHADFGPRLSIAWGLGHGASPKTVVRTGFGMFYDRFGVGDVLTARQKNGINENTYIVPDPNFYATSTSQLPSPSTLASLSTSTPSKYLIDPALRAPYTIESAASLERQVSKTIMTSATYIYSRGVHQFLTNNINTPLPGTFCARGDPNCGAPSAGVLPFGDVGDIYQFESVGNFKENQLIANFRYMGTSGIMLSGYYTLSYANSEPTGFPSNPYNIRQDYGPAGFAVRNQFFLMGSTPLPFGVSFSPMLRVTSGNPYSVTEPFDLLGTSTFNQRPAFASASQAGQTGIVNTSLGYFNLYPAPGQAVIPINYLTGPSQFSMDARLSKTFGFGKAGQSGQGGFFGGRGGFGRRGGLGPGGLTGGGGGGPRGFFGGGNSENHRYQLEVGLMVHNVFNKVNLSTPNGDITSPIFGQSNSLAGGFFGGGGGRGGQSPSNRSVNINLRFSF